MSLTFRVSVPSKELPPLHVVVADAAVAEPIQLAGAGWAGDTWPKGMLARVADAATTPSRLELTPEAEAGYGRAGLGGFFLAHARGSARGVVIVRTADTLAFQLPVFASAVDYGLAVALAASVARRAKRDIVVEDPAHADGGSVGPVTLAPAAFVERWSAAAATDHALRIGAWLAEDIAQGRAYWFYGPRGFVEIRPTDLEGVDAGRRFARAQEILVGVEADAVPIDARRCAVLLTAAMAFAAGADGVLADEEARQLEAHFATVRELAIAPPRELLDAVRAEVGGIEMLRELPSTRLRRKAFVLAAEIIASARGGKLDGDPFDPNVRAVISLAKALSLVDDQVFVAQVVRTVMAKYEKYEESAADDAIARALVLAMSMTAAADGVVDEQEAAVLSALARTVPELRTREVGDLFEAAKARTKDGADVALHDLEDLPRCKSKCFALATEVALVSGNGPAGTLLPRLRETLCPDRDDADAAIATFAAKYAS